MEYKLRKNSHEQPDCLRRYSCLGIAAAGSAMAESDIRYYGSSAPRHDTKLKKAAIKIAAKKIGYLRQSIDGDNTNIVLSATAQDERQG